MGKGTEINLRMDQLMVLDYWAQARQFALVGVSLRVANHVVEHWLMIIIHFVCLAPEECLASPDNRT
jgi:hypothetical protein